jgi:trehalose 2-sulfotransferase
LGRSGNRPRGWIDVIGKGQQRDERVGVLTIERLAMTGKRFYCICFSMRSGSSLLCDDLEQWRVGEPTEYFQLPNPGLAGANMAHHLVALAEAARDDCFGFKISWDQAFELVHRLRADGDQSVRFDLRTVFPGLSYIHVVRRDKVAQAVSTWRAGCSGTWHWPIGTDVDRGYPQYDFEAIKSPLQKVLGEDWLWERHFQRVGIQPLTIAYEDYVQDRVRHLHRVAEHVGVTASPMELHDRLHVMRDGWTWRTAQTFEADLYTVPDPLVVRTVQTVAASTEQTTDSKLAVAEPVPARKRTTSLRALPSLAAPIAVVFGVAATAEFAVPQVTLAPLLILAPLIAGLVLSARGIVFVTVVAALLMLPLGVSKHLAGAAEIWIIAGIVAAAVAARWVRVGRLRLRS